MDDLKNNESPLPLTVVSSEDSKVVEPNMAPVLEEMKIDDVEIAQYKFFIGGSIFLLFYSIQSVVVYYFSGNTHLVILYMVLLIPTGNFALNYHHKK